MLITLFPFSQLFYVKLSHVYFLLYFPSFRNDAFDFNRSETNLYEFDHDFCAALYSYCINIISITFTSMNERLDRKVMRDSSSKINTTNNLCNFLILISPLLILFQFLKSDSFKPDTFVISLTTFFPSLSSMYKASKC